MLSITYNIVVKLLVFVKIKFKWALDDCYGNLNVEIGEMNIQRTIKYPIFTNIYIKMWSL